MTEDEKADKLNLLVDNLFGPIQRNALGMNLPPFDIRRPNIHESKREFLEEKKMVSAVRNHLSGILDLLVSQSDQGNENPLRAKMFTRLREAIELNVTQRTKNRKMETAGELALRNLHQTGFYFNSLFVVFDMNSSYNQRLRDLEEQEVQFWSVPNRAPNYYARTIALRFARLFAGRTKMRPTFGISSEGSHPSTDFGRALEEVFNILEIKASVRNAAEWALLQLTENDWSPHPNTRGTGLLAMLDGTYRQVAQPDPKTEIVRLLNEKGK